MRARHLAVQGVTYILVVGIFAAAAVCGSRAVGVLAQMVPVPRSNRIVIDAGHGGMDGGATSCTGKLESAYNLEIAWKLNDLLHLLGHDTIMTRTSDRSIETEGKTIAERKLSDLKQRVQIVNETEHALLVSIHQNTFSDSRYSGAQVFYGPEGEGQRLAEDLQSALCATINPGSNRSCKKADNVYLMQHIRCTGVLVECGFLSNVQEEAKLSSPDYQRKLCCVIAATLSRFLKTDP